MARLLSTLALALLLWLLPEWWRSYSAVQIGRDAAMSLLWAAAVAGGVTLGRRRRREEEIRKEGRQGDVTNGGDTLPVEVWVLGAFLLAVSLATFASQARFYFVAWSITRESLRSIWKLGSVHYVVLSGLFAAVFAWRGNRGWLRPLLFLALVAGQLGCAVMLLRVTGGLTVYSDDHPSFLFRIAEFWGSFPWRETYVPHWNAGVVNSVLVSSGTPGYALLAAPLWWFFEPHQVHTFALILVFIVAVPWVNVWAFRSLGLGHEGAVAGGILALTAGRQFFVWTMHFGTVGAGLSWAMLPAAFAFLHAVAVQRRTGLSTWCGLVFTMFFMAQWPPTTLVAIAFVPLLLVSCRRWSRRRVLLPLLGAGFVLAALLAHNFVVVAGGKELLGYTLEDAGGSWGWGRVFRMFQRGVGPGILELSPLVAAFGVVGVAAMPWRRLKWWSATTLLVLAGIFTLGPIAAPRLQLERMAIAAGCVAILPTACWLRRIWGAKGRAAVVLQAATLSLLFLGITSTMRLYASQGFAPFTALRPSIRQFADWIEREVPEDGRLLFAGPTVHAYGRGHVAYLPILTGREMMACDYYGFPPGMVEMDYPPRASRTRPGGMHGFMKLHGVTHVVTYHQRYIDYFRSKPKLYRELEAIRSEETESYVLFRVLDSGGRFLLGSGSIQSKFNRLEVVFEDPPPEIAVIAYNWDERLQADPPASIHAHETGLGATFIGIRPNGACKVRIRYRNRF